MPLPFADLAKILGYSDVPQPIEKAPPIIQTSSQPSRSSDKANEDKMSTFLENRVFPLLVKAGYIESFRRGEAEEDKSGADFVFTYKDGTTANVDVKTRWSKMNEPDNKYVPCEYITNNRNGEEIEGWMVDMDPGSTSENKKNTDIIYSIIPTRVDAETPEEATVDDIKEIRSYMTPVKSFIQHISDTTGKTPKEMHELAHQAKQHTLETGNKKYKEGLNSLNAQFITSPQLRECPTNLLIHENEFLKSGAIMVNYEKNSLLVYSQKQRDEALKFNKEPRKESPVAQLKKNNSAPYFSSGAPQKDDLTK